jgi:hypothetical protein
MNHTGLLTASVNEWRLNHFTLLFDGATHPQILFIDCHGCFPQTCKQIEILYLCTFHGRCTNGKILDAAGLHNRLGLITTVSLQEQYCDSVTLLCISVYLHKVPRTVLPS